MTKKSICQPLFQYEQMEQNFFNIASETVVSLCYEYMLDFTKKEVT